MPAWFDLFGLSPNDPEDSDGIAAACRLVHGMIDAEVSFVSNFLCRSSDSIGHRLQAHRFGRILDGRSAGAILGSHLWKNFGWNCRPQFLFGSTQ